MRKTAAAVVVIACLWIGYTAWPIYDLYVLVRALETRDVGTVTRHIYFDEVRKSITQQLVSAYERRTGTQINPFARNMAANAVAVADPVMSKLFSPEGLADLLSAGWPVSIMPAASGAVGIQGIRSARFGKFSGIRNMASAGSEYRPRWRYLRSIVSISNSGCCSGSGDWWALPCQSAFRTCCG